MKNFLLFIGCCLLLFACTSPGSGNDSNAGYTAPPAGTVITSGSTETDEELNHFKFSVFVKSGEMSDKGIYDVVAVYGHDTAAGQFTMPRGGEHLRPLLKQGDNPGSFIVGFHYGSDTSFYDYYEIAMANRTMSMRYVKAYSFK